MAIEQMFEIAARDRAEAVVSWHAPTDVTAQEGGPTRHDQYCRNRITVLAARLLCDGNRDPGWVLQLHEELAKVASPEGPRGRAKAVVVSTAARYLRAAPAGLHHVLLEGNLVLPFDLGFNDEPDAVVIEDGQRWTYDIFSVAVRPERIEYDAVGGRVQRAVRHATSMIARGVRSADVRLFGPTDYRPRVVARVESRVLKLASSAGERARAEALA